MVCHEGGRHERKKNERLRFQKRCTFFVFHFSCMSVDADVAVERSLRGSSSGTAAARNVSTPVIDLNAVSAADELWAAATSVGFFTVINHGIDELLIDRCFASSKDFFAQEQQMKREQSPFEPKLNSGYEYMTQIRPSTGVADQKESLQITARTGCMEGRWPSKPSHMESDARTLMQASLELGQRLLTLLEPRACPHLSPGTLASAHTLWTDDSQCTLRLIHYPPTEPPLTGPHATSGPTQWRAGPHTDWCCVTLLYQRPGNEGLECAANPRAGSDAGWMAVDPVVGGIAVNIGDMLSRWSAGRLLSNLHRVRMPTAAECDPPRSRHSMAFCARRARAASARRAVRARAPVPAPSAGSCCLHVATAPQMARARARLHARPDGDAYIPTRDRAAM